MQPTEQTAEAYKQETAGPVTWDEAEMLRDIQYEQFRDPKFLAEWFIWADKKDKKTRKKNQEAIKLLDKKERQQAAEAKSMLVSGQLTKAKATKLQKHLRKKATGKAAKAKKQQVQKINRKKQQGIDKVAGWLGNKTERQ